jgi:hypothetical protein
MKTGLRFAADRENAGGNPQRRRRCGNVGIRRFLPDFQARWEEGKSPALPAPSAALATGLFPSFHGAAFPQRPLPHAAPRRAGGGATERGGGDPRGAHPHAPRKSFFPEVRPWA